MFLCFDTDSDSDPDPDQDENLHIILVPSRAPG